MVDETSAGGDPGSDALADAPPDALDELSRLRDEARTEDPARRARALARLAVNLQGRQRPTEALDAIEEARSAFFASGDSQGEILCDRLAARLLIGLGRPLDASKRLTAARRQLLDGQSDPAELASCEQQLAGVLHTLGRDRDVVSLLVSARELFTKADQRREAGVCDNDLGVLRAKAGDLTGAMDHFADARDCFADYGRDLAVVAFNEALALWDQHRETDAIEKVREARAAFVAAEADLEVAWCDQNLGVLLASTGHLKEAASRIVGAQDRYRAAEHWTAVAWCDANLAIVIDAIDGDGGR
jgi:tetratricopeptide (TPR) repeat protein